MQRAATVGVVCALIALMVRASIAVVMMRMFVIGVESGSSCEGLRAGQRRRDGARELGENKHRHHHMDKTADHP
jgi:UDP-N-acetylmuramyl pentapeptide phosphotransferase/UDP-N-acetylglucosamine-1-phosphate transferase